MSDRAVKFAFCVPTLGVVNIRWVKHLMDVRLPMNTARYDSIVTTTPQDVKVNPNAIADSRNKIVEECLSVPEITHLFWIDDDVLVDSSALMKLFHEDLDIVAGYYYTKNPACPEPLVLEHKSGGVRRHFDGSVIPVVGHGMGLTLIKRHVFETIPAPWFKTVRGGQTGPREISDHTEDTYFCARAIEYGFQPHVDTSTFGFHWDEKRKMASPWVEWQKYRNGEAWVLPGHDPVELTA